MKTQKIIGLVIAAIGIVMLAFSLYIKQQIAQGKEEISAGEKKIKTATSIFSLTPQTRQVGEGITGSGNKKISEGKQKISEYEILANQLQTGGIVLIIVGGGIYLFASRKKKR